MVDGKLRVALLVDYLFTDYTNELIEGVRRACAENNIELLVFPIGTKNSDQSKFDYQLMATSAHVTSKNIDGIIIASGTQMHHLKKEELHSYLKAYQPIPVVSITIPFSDIPSVVVESEKAYRQLVEHLIKVQGCKKFGIMSVKSDSSEVINRINTIRGVLAECSVPEQQIYVWDSKFEYPYTKRLLQEYFKQNHKFDFDALIAFNDEMAFACEDFCTEINLKVPEDVVVTGFDDLEQAQYANPSLSTINQNIAIQGYEAVKLLRSILSNRPVKNLVTVDSVAILRESTSRIKPSKTIQTDFLKVDNVHPAFEALKSSASDWYEKKSQLFQITYFYTEMQYDMSLLELKKRISQDLQNFGISAAVICMYEKPVEMINPFDYFALPKKASVFAAYDTIFYPDRKVTDDPLTFDPTMGMLPAGLISNDATGLFVLPLYHNEMQFGYLVFRRGNFDNVIYDLLSKILSYIISSVYSFSLVHDEQTRIQKENIKLSIANQRDELTGLYNMRGFSNAGAKVLEKAEELDQRGIIIYCDIDGLKKINDTYGHEAGDRAIIAESIILQANFRQEDIIAHKSGDEFVIICNGGMTRADFEKTRKQVDQDCAKWVRTNNSPFSISISMGCVEYPHPELGYALKPLMEEADSDLYKVKFAKKDKIRKMPVQGELTEYSEISTELQEVVSLPEESDSSDGEITLTPDDFN